MDVETQRRHGNKVEEGLSIACIKSKVEERAKHPTVTGAIILLLIFNSLMMVIGFMHLDDCPVRTVIPIYLAVAGTTGVVSKLLPFINREFPKTIFTVLIYVLYTFEFVWMCLGAYWVYSIYQPNFDKGKPNYCNKTAYLLAFWLTNVYLLVFAIAVVLICCITICNSLKK